MSGAGRQLTGDELHARQQQVVASTRRAPEVIATKMLTPENMGAVLRVADGAGCERVTFMDDAPADAERLRKVARSANRNVAWSTSTESELLAQERANLIAIELTTTSQSIFEAKLPANCTFVLGSERHGIPESVLAQCSAAVHVPMYGTNGSMNVTHALAIVLFEWRRRHGG